MPEIQEDIYKRIRGNVMLLQWGHVGRDYSRLGYLFLGFLLDPLVSFLSTGNPELAYACLAHLQLLAVRAPKILNAYSKHFYRR